MDREKIMEIIYGLSKSQGRLTRLFNELCELYTEDYDAYDEYMAELEAMNFKDGLDLIMFLEGN